MGGAGAEAAETGLVVRLFGGVEFCGAAGTTSFSGAKQRALVARLAIDAGHAVSSEQLVDSVWGEQAPTTVRASVQVHISQIRRALADAGLPDVLLTRPAGYVLDIDPDQIDVHRFEVLAAQARVAHDDGREESALDLITRALDLWRGPPLAGAGDAPFVDSVTPRLEGQRLELMPIAAASSIATGRITEVLALVESMVAQYPYNEPLWESSARLLYAQGRQADALDRLATVRRVLLEELGLDPSPAIVELERQILTHEPALAPVTTRRSTAGQNTGSKLPATRPLVGRDDLIADLVGAVTGAPLITLTGPGGVGKTSLAVHVAVTYGARCRDGVCFVDLTSISAGHDPLPALIGALGMMAKPDGTDLDDVVDLLVDRDQILVFDNCEHVLTGCVAVLEALASCPNLRLLATSRESIGLTGELVVEVPPLSPADGAELFVRRAQASVSGFALEPSDIDDVRRIVELVDGLPLALELASPLVRLLSPSQISEELAHDHPMGTARRGRDRRHSSMNDAVAWSYELLDEDSRTLFQRFSVFEGGTDLSGVIAVCVDDVDGRLPRAVVLEGLEGLVARSLVSVERTSSGMRYRMLVPVQLFARRMLEESGDAEQLRHRHVRHVIAWLIENADVIESTDPRPGLAAFERAAANIRAAHRSCVEAGDGRLAADIVSAISTLAFRDVVAIPELRAWVREGLLVDDLAPRTRLGLLLAAAMYLDEPMAESISQATRAIDLARDLEDESALVLATVALAHTVAESDNVAATELLSGVLEAATRTSSVHEGVVLNYLTSHLLRAGRRDDVTALLDDRLALGTKRFGLFEPVVLYQCGRAALEAGDFEAARRLYAEVDIAAHRTGSVFGQSFVLFGLAQLALHEGNLEEAITRSLESLDLDLLLDPREVWADRFNIVLAASRLGDVDLATAQLDALVDVDRPVVRAVQAVMQGCVASMNGNPRVAAAKFAHAARLSAPIGKVLLRVVLREWSRTSTDDDLVRQLDLLLARFDNDELTNAEVVDAVESITTT